MCRLVEDRIRQVGETQSAAAVDVHHLVTAPRWNKTHKLVVVSWWTFHDLSLSLSFCIKKTFRSTACTSVDWRGERDATQALVLARAYLVFDVAL